MENRKFMNEALNEAKKAFDEGEVPVGAVIVKNGEIVSKAHNVTEKNKNPLCHGEIIAVDKALSALESKNLNGCTAYITMEPCPMCMAALLHSKIDEIVFGAYDERAGASGSKIDLTEINYFRTPKITGGYMEEECKKLLTDFFKTLREK